MPVSSVIIDSRTGKSVKVGLDRALAVGPSSPSLPFNAELAVDDVPVNIVPAVGNSIFCMTGIVLTGDKNISTTVDATVSIYTSDTNVSAVALTTLLAVPVQRSGQLALTNILIEAEEGKYINGVTSDDNVFVTILGFYISTRDN